MSEEGTGKNTADGDLLPDLNLRSAADSIAEARAHLELRQSVGRELRAVIKHILEAQENFEGRGSVAETRLDLMEAIRLIGIVETLLKGGESDLDTERPPLSGTGIRPPSMSKAAAEPSEWPRSRKLAEVDSPGEAERVSSRETPTDPLPPRGQLSALATGRSPAPIPAPGADLPAEVSEHPGVPHGSGAQGRAAGVEEQTSNRRAYRRLSAGYPIQLQPPYNGFSNSDLTQLPISGITLNLCRGGMLAQIEQGTLRHGRYLIRFLGAGENVRPEIMWGRVRRSRAADGTWQVGIEFDSPLERLKP
jgi:hypothetical protein